MTFGGPEMIIVLVLVLVLFGGSQLPKLARNLGKAQKEFKDGIAAADEQGGEGTAPSRTNDPGHDAPADGSRDSSSQNSPTRDSTS